MPAAVIGGVVLKEQKMVFCDEDGELYDHPFYNMAVDDGYSIRALMKRASLPA